MLSSLSFNKTAICKSLGNSHQGNGCVQTRGERRRHFATTVRFDGRRRHFSVSCRPECQSGRQHPGVPQDFHGATSLYCPGTSLAQTVLPCCATERQECERRDDVHATYVSHQNKKRAHLQPEKMLIATSTNDLANTSSVLAITQQHDRRVH